MVALDKTIKEKLTVTINYIDLFYAFCAAKGIDDPESVDTDEEYSALEKEFESKITYNDISDLSQNIMHNTMEIINCAMQSVANR